MVLMFSYYLYYFVACSMRLIPTPLERNKKGHKYRAWGRKSVIVKYLKETETVYKQIYKIQTYTNILL